MYLAYIYIYIYIYYTITVHITKLHISHITFETVDICSISTDISSLQSPPSLEGEGPIGKRVFSSWGGVGGSGVGWAGMIAFTWLATNVILRYAMFLLHVGTHVTLRYGMFIGTCTSKVDRGPNRGSSVETIETFCSKELPHSLWIGRKR